MDSKSKYELWLKKVDNPRLLEELRSIKNSEEEIQNRFYKFIDFGTAGLRGIMGVGTNRINLYTVRWVTQGLAEYLRSTVENPSVAISYDSRNNSKNFASYAAEVFAGNGVKVYLTSELQPTPYLSFCIRYFKCDAGVMITASHNTSEYNGYKCYGADGAQITEEAANKIYSSISKIDIFKEVKSISIIEGIKKGLIFYIDEKVYNEYLRCVLNQKVNEVNFSDLKVVYTPLNGAGFKPVCNVLKSVGLKNLKVVEKQSYADGNFSTCKYPNPEILEAFELAIKEAKVYDADLIIATDPDSDRLGVCVPHNGNYKLLSGNQLGLLLFYYLIKSRQSKLLFPKNPILIKTLVSSKLVNEIAYKNGVEVIEVPTGFKNIASEIAKLENQGELSRFIFGFEESNGYLCGAYVRDKDAVSAALLICEALAYFKYRGLTFLELLENLSQEYGFFGEKTVSLEYKGYEGSVKIKNIMTNLRRFPPKYIGEMKILDVNDYLKSNLGSFSNLNIISLSLEDGEIVIRPSGTEPKIKAYIMLRSNNKKSLNDKLSKMKMEIEDLINKFSF